jgi:glycosyltransferase involved in cell wall biosynthesis
VNDLRHVLMTADAVGGVWTYALELARALALQGVRVSLATMGPAPRADQRREALRIPGLALHESDYRLEWMDDPWADVEAASDWLLSLEDRFSPDLIHLNGYAHGALPWKAPCVVVAHSCVVSWWNAVHRCEPPESWAIYRDRVRAGLSRAHAVLAVSGAMADSLRRNYRVGETVAIANSGDANVYRPGRKEQFVLTCGRAWDAAKNIQAVEEASSSISWPVFLAGDTTHPESGAACVHHMQMLGRLGAEELRGWFARASIYVLPALYEPFGLSVLEAALAGCALVLGDIPSLRENWDGAALFVDPRDPGALAAAVNHLCRITAFRQNAATRARRRALRFSPERMATCYLTQYARVLQTEAVLCAS